MIRLALAGSKKMHVSDLEMQRPGPSFSIDTIITVRGKVKPEAALFFILGLDAFLSIHSWKDWFRLMSESCMAVMSRPVQNDKVTGNLVKQLETYLNSTLSLDYIYDELHRCFRHPELQPVYPVEIKPLDISSSHIRNCLKNKLPIEAMVPKAVAAYIKEKGLYL